MAGTKHRFNLNGHSSRLLSFLITTRDRTTSGGKSSVFITLAPSTNRVILIGWSGIDNKVLFLPQKGHSFLYPPNQYSRDYCVF